MKALQILLLSALCVIFFSPKAHAKDEDQSHTFKIKGSTHVPTENGEKVVEYDPKSADHLFITDFDKSGRMMFKGQFLFIGKEFNLSADYLKYVKKKELIIDGPVSTYKDGILEKTLTYRKDAIISQMDYYPNGQPKSLVPGDPELNGEFKMWYPNGQLSFKGNYTDNLKEGEFELLDESGKTLKKGVYQKGKLLSGEPVIADIVYTSTEVAAEYAKGEQALNQYLTLKAAELGKSKIVYSNKEYDLQIIFDESGKITSVLNRTNSNKAERETVELILKDCPSFNPALVENFPVKSTQAFTLQVANGDVKLWPADKVYTTVDENPEFKGGPTGLYNYIASQIRYPSKAIDARAQGKVLVTFVINKDGKIGSARVVRGVHPLLDEEALRVVNNMPEWKPGKMHEKPVRVSYTMPINFNLVMPGETR